MIPELIDLPNARRKELPPGRHPATVSEVEEAYVPDGDENREKLWAELLTAMELFSECVKPLAEVWVGGSFTTSEEHPHDLDVVFLFPVVDDNDPALKVVNRFHTAAKQSLPDVQIFYLPVPRTGMGNEPSWYMQNRGYWDQFWSKYRRRDSDVPPHYPLSGYLAVSCDGGFDQ